MLQHSRYIPILNRLSVLLSCFLVACANTAMGQSIDRPAFGPSSVFHNSLQSLSPEVRRLNHSFQELSKPKRPSPLKIFVDKKWRYELGTLTERLEVNLSHLPQNHYPVEIPHRILKPNRPLWYTIRLPMPQPVTLRVHADDGAQLWYDDIRIPVYRGRSFNLPASQESKQLVIRVLNNAMWGGLKAVRAYDQKQYTEYLQYRRLYRRIERLVKKATIESTHLPPEMIATIQTAVDNPAGDRVSVAEKKVTEYPHFITPPYLQQTGSDSLSILWETDLASHHELTLGLQPDQLNRSIESDSVQTLHEVRLTNMEPGETYYYRIKQGKIRSNLYRFRIPRDTTHFQFAIWGDSQSGWKTFDQIVHAMQSHPLQFTIGVGDLTNESWRSRQYSQLLQTLHPVSAHIPTFFIPGNHDYDGYYDSMIPKNYHRYIRNGHESPQTYYSWSSGNAAFIALDPHHTFPIGLTKRSEQYQWLKGELKKSFWTEATWNFILLHHPPYAQGWPGYHGEISVRDALEPLLREHNIDFVVAGHSHAYERLVKQYGDHRTYYIVTGGAGGGLEPGKTISEYPEMDRLRFKHHYTHWHIKGDTLFFKAIDSSRNVLDQLKITN